MSILTESHSSNQRVNISFFLVMATMVYTLVLPYWKARHTGVRRLIMNLWQKGNKSATWSRLIVLGWKSGVLAVDILDIIVNACAIFFFWMTYRFHWIFVLQVCCDNAKCMRIGV